MTFDRYTERLQMPTWYWDNTTGWIRLPYDPGGPYTWEIGLPPTAYMFESRVGPVRSGSWWFTHCPYCGVVILKMHGQIGWCDEFDSSDDLVPIPPYPSFGHETPKLRATYVAATSARFEFGERG